MLKDQNVLICMNSRNISHYKKLGYDVKVGEKILVKISDLTPGAHVRINVICDECGGELGKGQAIYDMLCKEYGEKSCKQEFLLQHYSLDCVVNINDAQIDVEYDGEFWHEGREEYDSRRDNDIMSFGYKIIRIKSKKLIPTIDLLKQSVDLLINNDENITHIILKDSKYYTI